MSNLTEANSAVSAINEMFPRGPGAQHSAITGLIPIQDFNIYEPLLRPLMRKAGLRAIYRGPRVSNFSRGSAPSMTRRRDATGVLIYYS